MGQYHLRIVIICYLIAFMLFCTLKFIKSPNQSSPDSKKQIDRKTNKQEKQTPPRKAPTKKLEHRKPEIF